MKSHRLLPAACCLLPAACCLLAGLRAAPAPAQCENGVCRPNALPASTTPHPSVVRVMNAAGSNRYYGSGTLVEVDVGQSVVITCAHLFPRKTGSVTVTFAEGRHLEAQVLGVDPSWDLAALEIGDTQASPVTIATQYPEPGEPLTSCGYGCDGRYWCNQGRALGYVRTAAGNSYETLELSGVAREGDSGGPVFNQRGELVAVLWGTDGRMVGGTYCGRIRKFLARLLPFRRAPAKSQPPPEALTPISPPRPPAQSRPSSPQSPAQGDRMDAIHKRLESLGADLQEAHRRLAGQEQSLSQRIQQVLTTATGLRERLEKAEAAVGPDNLRGVMREVAKDVLADRGPTLAAKVLPAALTALGWTGPPSVAVIVGLRVLAAIWKRRRARSVSSKAQAAETPAKPRPLNDEYADQLAGVFALSGRSPLADATLGREYDEELRNAAESSDGTLARWARSLRDRVAQRFYRIHGQSPLPAEPLGSAKGAA